MEIETVGILMTALAFCFGGLFMFQSSRNDRKEEKKSALKSAAIDLFKIIHDNHELFGQEYLNHLEQFTDPSKGNHSMSIHEVKGEVSPREDAMKHVHSVKENQTDDFFNKLYKYFDYREIFLKEIEIPIKIDQENRESNQRYDKYLVAFPPIDETYPNLRRDGLEAVESEAKLLNAFKEFEEAKDNLLNSI